MDRRERRHQYLGYDGPDGRQQDRDGPAHQGIPHRGHLRELLDQRTRLRKCFARGGPARAGTETVDLRAVAADAIRLVGLSDRGKKVTFQCHCSQQLNVRGDPQQLSQVIVNLLTNACDASDPGQEVSVDISSDQDWVTLVVADAGQGMNEEDQALVFEPFFTTKSPGQGTGLGLAVVYRIVEQHRGQIHIESRPGEGTRFSVTLPAA